MMHGVQYVLLCSLYLSEISGHSYVLHRDRREADMVVRRLESLAIRVEYLELGLRKEQEKSAALQNLVSQLKSEVNDTTRQTGGHKITQATIEDITTRVRKVFEADLEVLRTGLIEQKNITRKLASTVQRCKKKPARNTHSLDYLKKSLEDFQQTVDGLNKTVEDLQCCKRQDEPDHQDGSVGKGELPCKPLVKPNNGWMFIRPGRPLLAAFGCHSGFAIRGSTRRFCLPDGSWNGTEVNCEKIVCKPLVSPNNGWMNVSENRPLVATFGCRSGFSIRGSTQRFCLRDGLWNGTEVSCEKLPCKPLLSPANGWMNMTQGRPLVATFGCRSGFSIRGSTQRFCLRDGSWNGTQVSCEISCPKCFEDANNRTQPTLLELISRVCAEKMDYVYIVTVDSIASVSDPKIMRADVHIIAFDNRRQLVGLKSDSILWMSKGCSCPLLVNASYMVLSTEDVDASRGYGEKAELVLNEQTHNTQFFDLSMRRLTPYQRERALEMSEFLNKVSKNRRSQFCE